MKTYQKTSSPLVIVAIALVAIVLVAVLVWLFAANVFVGGHMYPRSAEYLNLRDKELSAQEYDKLQNKLPDCEIYWDVPFQGKTYPENTVVLKVDELSAEDVEDIRYFKHLEVVNAMNCTDYAQLLALQEKYPDVTVGYAVHIGGNTYMQDAQAVTLATLTEQDIELMQYLPDLVSVDAEQCDAYGLLEVLKQRYPQLQVASSVKLCGQAFTSDTTEMTVTGMTDAEMDLLKYLPNLKTVLLKDPAMTPEKLFGIREVYPNIDINWEMEAFGSTVRSDATDIVFEGVDVDVARLKEVMELLPGAKSVFLNDCNVDNEAMAAFREEKRDEYTVVWTVDCGGILVRTDDKYFMPIKHKVFYFFDEDTYNLRYCEDMEAIDLGHMSIKNADFAAFMPKLKYLILAHTRVSDISGLSNCKSLLFLEMDWSEVKDYTPLLGCTSLEDLNISKNNAPIDPILQMSWLKHIWAIDRGAETRAKLTETFGETDTVLYLEGPATVSGGWRELPNYYAMRDTLEMPYMAG